MSSSVDGGGDTGAPESQPEKGTATAASAGPGWEQVIEVNSRGDLFASHLGEPISDYQKRNGPGLSFRGPQGGVSRRSAPVRPGDVFKAITTVQAEGEGDSPPVHFGPMFLDARDNVLFHSASVPLKQVGAVQPIEIEHAAPPGAMAVRLRLVGGWSEQQDAVKLLYTYGTARLFRKIR